MLLKRRYSKYKRKYRNEELLRLIKKDYNIPGTTIEEMRTVAQSLSEWWQGVVSRMQKLILLTGILVIGIGVYHLSLHGTGEIGIEIILLLLLLILAAIVGIFRLILFQLEIVNRTLGSDGQ